MILSKFQQYYRKRQPVTFKCLYNVCKVNFMLLKFDKPIKCYMKYSNYYGLLKTERGFFLVVMLNLCTFF